MVITVRLVGTVKVPAWIDAKNTGMSNYYVNILIHGQ